MLVVFVGAVLLFANINLGIFVIILGVMLWTSGKSRKLSQKVADRILPPDRDARRDVDVPPAEIVAVRRKPRELHPS